MDPVPKRSERKQYSSTEEEREEAMLYREMDVSLEAKWIFALSSNSSLLSMSR